MFTKPCERADRGCAGLAKGLSRNQLAKRRFCSLKCLYEHRRETGALPVPHLTSEQRRAFGRKGGIVGGARRRRQALQTYVDSTTAQIPESLRGKLTFREQTLLTVLMVRTWEEAHRLGMTCARQQGYAEQARKRATAA